MFIFSFTFSYPKKNKFDFFFYQNKKFKTEVKKFNFQELETK